MAQPAPQDIIARDMIRALVFGDPALPIGVAAAVAAVVLSRSSLRYEVLPEVVLCISYKLARVRPIQ
mgnify:CR=1 FL=1